MMWPPPPVRCRWLNRWYALLLGYFWLPCPICDEPFGGHECIQGHVVWIDEIQGRAVCYKESCYLVAKRLSTEAIIIRK